MADTARTLMRQVPVVAPDTDVATATRLMSRLQVRHLAVVEQRQCVGLVGEQELAGATGPDDLVGLLCRRPAPCVPPDADRRHIDEQLRHDHTDALGGERQDTAGIDRLLSCGAALANIVLAVRALGWDIAVSLDGEPDLVARVTAVLSEPPCERELELYRAITAPDGVGRGHGGTEELHRLRAISHFRTARLEPVGGVAFAAILHDARRQLDGDRRCAAELIPWLPQPELVPTQRAAGPATRRETVLSLAGRLSARPMFAVVTDSDTRADHMLAGAVMQIAMLAAPGLGFIPHPVVRPMHLDDTRLRLMNGFALNGFPQALLGVTPAELNPWSQT